MNVGTPGRSIPPGGNAAETRRARIQRDRAREAPARGTNAARFGLEASGDEPGAPVAVVPRERLGDPVPRARDVSRLLLDKRELEVGGQRPRLEALRVESVLESRGAV